MANNPHLEDEFVNVHGQAIAGILNPNTGEIGFDLAKLKQTGVFIYKKSKFAKLATLNTEFDDNFNFFMLEAAQEYMLQNKVVFSEQQILDTIENCKEHLAGGRLDKSTNSSKKLALGASKSATHDYFFNNRQIVNGNGTNIAIKLKTPSSPTHSKNKSVRKEDPIFLLHQRPAYQEIGNGAMVANSSSPPSPPLDKLRQKLLAEKIKTRAINVGKSQNGDETTQLKKTSRESSEFYNTSVKKRDVVVTCISKKNCLWVRDKANNELFYKVYNMSADETEGQEAALKPWTLDKVYLGRHDDSWFRCKIISFNPLKVLFLDYGNTEVVDEIRDASGQLAAIPALAVKITFKPCEYDPKLEDEIRIKIFKQNKDGSYFANILSKATPSCGYFTKPKHLAQLENHIKVTILHEEDAIFHLRNLQCWNKLRQIEQEIDGCIQTAPNIVNVAPNQLVLCQDGGEYRRALVVEVLDENVVEVELLDYARRSTVKRNCLKAISESLSTEPLTYISGKKLVKFTNRNIDNFGKQIIKDSINKRKKFVVVLDDDKFDLFDGANNLSQLLANSSGITLQDIKPFKPDFGVNTYICGSYKSSTDFSLINVDAFKEHTDEIFRTDVNSEPHSPVVNEICLCYYNEDWYRCVVTRSLGQEYEVLLLDFGNIEIIRRDFIRKADNEVVKVPALALPCRLVNLPEVQNIEVQLGKLIQISEIYEVDVKGVSAGKYDVEISLVYKELKRSLQ